MRMFQSCALVLGLMLAAPALAQTQGQTDPYGRSKTTTQDPNKPQDPYKLPDSTGSTKSESSKSTTESSSEKKKSQSEQQPPDSTNPDSMKSQKKTP